MKETVKRAFFAMLAAERGAAKNTLESYARDLEDYAAFLAARRINAEEVGAQDIRAYLEHLTD
ncbi:MAG: site-specific integrase, partial [Proteobacteria bacterium]|nr:site-specific integrase [Pseudomonadota bacterium]